MKSRPQILNFFTAKITWLFSIQMLLIGLLGLPQRAQAAPLPITKPNFKLTFTEGYATAPYFPSNDSSFTVMNTVASQSAIVTGQGHHISSQFSPSAWAGIFSAAVSTNFTRIDSTTKTLGSNSFTALQYKDLSPNSDSTSRLRIYFTNKANYLFITWCIYDVADELAIKSSLESSLATLTITATTGIRTKSIPYSKAFETSRFDIQGRKWKNEVKPLRSVYLSRK